jgi:hypothetical protein
VRREVERHRTVKRFDGGTSNDRTARTKDLTPERGTMGGKYLLSHVEEPRLRLQRLELACRYAQKFETEHSVRGTAQEVMA